LFLSTFFPHTPPTFFFIFALTNGILQSSINCYFQTSVVAIASWFGPSAIQSMFSGQAAVAVLISVLELFSAITSIEVEETKQYISETKSLLDKESRASVDRSASMFFFSMMIGMIMAVGAHFYLTRMSEYKEASAIFDKPLPPATRQPQEQQSQASEETPLLVDIVNLVPALALDEHMPPSVKSSEIGIIYVSICVLFPSSSGNN
jgi:equilibrative nucleoside transporter 1/2/3